MTAPFLLAIVLHALPAAPTPPPMITLRDGRTFRLEAPARIENGRVVFTTVEGKTYSLDPADVRSEIDHPPTPTASAHTYNPQDSKDLGAIARQERAKTGKTSDLSATRPPPRPTSQTPKPRPTGTAGAKTAPRPSRTPTPPPANGAPSRR